MHFCYDVCKCLVLISFVETIYQGLLAVLCFSSTDGSNLQGVLFSLDRTAFSFNLRYHDRNLIFVSVGGEALKISKADKTGWNPFATRKVLAESVAVQHNITRRANA